MIYLGHRPDGSFRGVETLEQARELFWSKVRRGSPEECWPWTRGLNTRGYGQFSLAKFPIARTSHRWAFYLENGHLPDLEIRHLCHFPRCCNPRHLAMGTRLDNERDKDAAGRRPRGIKNLPCPHCGGPQEGRSKRPNGNQFAFCKPCRREYMRKYHLRRKAEKALASDYDD